VKIYKETVFLALLLNINNHTLVFITFHYIMLHYMCSINAEPVYAFSNLQ